MLESNIDRKEKKSRDIKVALYLYQTMEWVLSLNTLNKVYMHNTIFELCVLVSALLKLSQRKYWLEKST